MKDDKLNHSTSEEKTEMPRKERLSVKLLSLVSRKTKKADDNGEQQPEKPKKRRREQLRILPIWLRMILVVLLLVGVAALGLSIGYGYIGDGNAIDIFKKETWIHIVDIISGKEM